MLKMFRYMKERWYYLVMILLLLFVQAFCDLSLPDYTSDIINVGIQQKGVEDGVPETIREESMEKLFLFMDEKDQTQVLDNYDLSDGIYELKDLDSEEREELNSILGIPELIVTGLSDQSSQEVSQLREQMGIPAEADIFQVLEQLPKEQLTQMLSGMKEQFEEMPDSIVTQSAVLYVQEEYSAQGKDLDQMIEDNPELENVAKSVPVDVVARTLMTSTEQEPMTQATESALGYSVSGTFLVPGGGLFIKKSELARLGLRRQRYGVIDFYGND